MTLFTIILTYSPLAAEKLGGTTDRVAADSPYNGVGCSGGVTVTGICLAIKSIKLLET